MNLRYRIEEYKYFLRTEGLYWTVVRKNLYTVPPIKRLLSSFVNSLKPEYVVADGHIMFIDKSDDFVSQELIISKSWERFQTSLFKKHVKKGDIVLDIGAHIGWYTLQAARIVGSTGRVYAFEPDLKNFKLLKKNVNANGYTNVILVNKAVSNKTKKGRLYKSTNNTGDNRVFDSRDGRSSVGIQVIALDDFLKEKQVNFIKMDIQGFEANAVKGARKIIQSSKKLKIMTEFWPEGLKMSGSSAVEYMDLLLSSFSVYNVIEGATHKLVHVSKKNANKLHLFTNSETNLLCIK